MSIIIQLNKSSSQISPRTSLHSVEIRLASSLKEKVGILRLAKKSKFKVTQKQKAETRRLERKFKLKQAPVRRVLECLQDLELLSRLASHRALMSLSLNLSQDMLPEIHHTT